MTLDRRPLSRPVLFSFILGVGVLLLSAAFFFLIPSILHTLHPAIDPRSLSAQNSSFGKRFRTLEWGTSFAVLLIGPAIVASPLPAMHRRVSLLAVAAVSAFFAWYIPHFGNRQFGAWDFSILIDTGWRQIIGERPYTDFITPNPPGFNLGVYYAFRLFGVTWNAQLLLITIFCIGTFVWIFWLLRRLSISALASLFLAFAVQGVTIIPTCYWWYNNVTSVMATVFFLSVVVCARQERSDESGGANHAEWFSYCISLALLSFMKPNIAGVLIALAASLLFLVTKKKAPMLVCTAAGVAISLAVLLLHHISLHDMIASYRGAAIERGGLSHFGLTTYTRSQKLLLLVWTLLLAAPLGTLVPRVRTSWRDKRWKDIAFFLIFATALVVTLYGMLTNGEVKDSETPILIVSCGVILFALQRSRPLLTIFFLAMVTSMLVPSLYYGATRQRLLGMGEGMFFEYTGADQPVRDRFFQSLTATPHLDNVERELREAKASLPGPIFLGPRLEFNYADLGIPSPTMWPVYYQPGTSFARKREPELLQIWQQHHFQTLIFLGEDRTFYPPALLHTIDSNYRRMPGYKEIEVYVRRSP